jgi:23S rRNA (uridine2479-2'-O)-methyltransferase
MSPTVIKIHTRNSDFQVIETLRRNRVKRNQSKEFFVEGVRPIDQALLHGWQINAFIYTREKRLSDWAEGILEHSAALQHYELPASLMNEISQREDPSELVALVGMPSDSLARIPVRENPLIVVLDRPILPGNIGSVIRSCDALRVDGLVITGHSADLYDPETIRATTGSFFSIPTIRLSSYRELLAWVDERKQQCKDLRIVGTSAKASVPIDEFNFRLPTILIAGNETHGISENYRAACDALTTIPMSGSASSFNLACAVSILLYEVNRQRRLPDI